MAADEPVTWAILGTGAVAESFVQGLVHSGSRVAVVASRKKMRAESFARRHGARAASYAEAAADPSVKAVYIATPPSEHEQHALLSLAAGKATMIEKPFAKDAAAASRIAAAAQDASVFCVEAMWTRFLPLIREVRRRIDAGEIGELRQFHGMFCKANLPDADTSLFDPSRGGGALMHRGIYPLSLARYFLGPITKLQASARVGNTGVDEDCALVLQHTSGALSVLQASLVSNGPNFLVIQGTRGTIRLEPPLYRPPSGRLHYVTLRAGGTGGSAQGARAHPLAHALWQRLGPIQRALRPGAKCDIVESS